MSVIKLKQSDIEKIVKESIENEQYWTEEAMPSLEEEVPADQPEEPSNLPAKTLSMMAGDDGNYYVVDWSNPATPKILAKTNK